LIRLVTKGEAANLALFIGDIKGRHFASMFNVPSKRNLLDATRRNFSAFD